MTDKCRICGENTPTDAKELFKMENNLLVLNIELVTGEWLNSQPDWPSYICQRCEDDLAIAAAFRERCIQTQDQLRLEAVMAIAHPDDWEQLKRIHNSRAKPKLHIIKPTKFVPCKVILKKRARKPESGIVQSILELNEGEETQNESENFQVILDSEKPKSSNRNKKPKIKRSSEDKVCYECGKKFNKVQSLQNHILRHSGVKNFECSTCKKRFTTKAELKGHEVRHTDIRPYTCRKCNMTFTTTTCRLRHERSVHAFDRPFKCRFCLKTFAFDSVKLVHENNHLKVRQYRCEVCKESFRRLYNLRQHEKTQKHKTKEKNKNKDG